jgi:hypothetical protein
MKNNTCVEISQECGFDSFHCDDEYYDCEKVYEIYKVTDVEYVRTAKLCCVCALENLE